MSNPKPKLPIQLRPQVGSLYYLMKMGLHLPEATSSYSRQPPFFDRSRQAQVDRAPPNLRFHLEHHDLIVDKYLYFARNHQRNIPFVHTITQNIVRWHEQYNFTENNYLEFLTKQLSPFGFNPCKSNDNITDKSILSQMSATLGFPLIIGDAFELSHIAYVDPLSRGEKQANLVIYYKNKDMAIQQLAITIHLYPSQKQVSTKSLSETIKSVLDRIDLALTTELFKLDPFGWWPDKIKLRDKEYSPYLNPSRVMLNNFLFFARALFDKQQADALTLTSNLPPDQSSNFDDQFAGIGAFTHLKNSLRRVIKKMKAEGKVLLKDSSNPNRDLALRNDVKSTIACINQILLTRQETLDKFNATRNTQRPS